VRRRGFLAPRAIITKPSIVRAYGIPEVRLKVRIGERIQALLHQAQLFGRRWGLDPGGYPQGILDIIVFHKLHLLLPAETALKSYRQLKERFVDWNEVRISSVREIQDELAASSGTLEFAVFIKDLLEQVQRERQDVSLEFLAEENLGEIRRYLKQMKGMDSATVDLVLRIRKEHPVLPLNHSLEVVLSRLGIFRDGETRDRKEKTLHECVEAEKALALHHFLVEVARETCPLDPERLECPRCPMRAACDFYARLSKRAKKNSPKESRPARGASGRAAAPARRHAPSVKPRRLRGSARIP
jgi:endonuclease-3